MERLDSWKEIAAYLGREVRTVQGWEKNEGLPIHRHQHARLGSVYAFKHELDAWRETRKTQAAVAVEGPPAAAQPSKRTWLWIAAALALAFVAVGVTIIILLTRRSEPLHGLPLTSALGQELEPSLSPEGSRVAYSWNGDNRDNFDIYIKLIGPGPPLRLTTDPAEDSSPAWSPDGRRDSIARRTGACRRRGALLAEAVASLPGAASHLERRRQGRNRQPPGSETFPSGHARFNSETR